MSLIGAIRVTMGLDSAAYESRLRRVTRQTQQSGNIITRTFRGMGGLAGGLTALFSLALIKRTLDTAGAIGEVAQQLGVTTRDLQVYRYAASQVGVANEEMEKGLQKLTRTMGEAANGAKTQQGAFRALGIDVRDATGRIKTAGEIMPEIADAIARIPDAASRAAVLVRLFGRAGQQMAPLFAEGAEGIRQFAARAEELGLVLSEDEIRNADRTADKIEELNRALSANFSRIVAQNASAILQLATALGSLAARVVQFLGSNPVRALQLIGALGGASIGSRLGGGPGAAIGGALGFLFGGNAAATPESDARARGMMAAQRRNSRMRSLGVRVGTDGRYRRDDPNLARAWRDPVVRREHNEFRRHAGEARRQAATNAPAAVELPPVDLSNLAGGGGGGGGGGSGDAERERKEALRNAHEHATALRRLQVDELRASGDLTRDTTARADIEASILALDREQELADIKLAVDLGDLTEAKAEELRIAGANVQNLRQQAISYEEQRDLAERAQELADERHDIAANSLRAEGEMARTAEERRRAELRLLDLTYRHQRAKLDAVINDTSVGRDEHAVARARIQRDGLDAGYASDQGRVRRETMGPLASFLDSLPRTAAEANEALEAVAANGLSSLVDGLANAMVNIRSLGDAFKTFKNIALQALADVLKVMLQRQLFSLLSSFMPGGGGGLGSVALAGANGSGGLAGLPGMATGGAIRIGGMAGVDRNLLSINQRPVARVNMGETVHVTPRGASSGRPIIFDNRGAVMTEDLLRQMEQMANGAAMSGAQGGMMLARADLSKRARRRLGR